MDRNERLALLPIESLQAARLLWSIPEKKHSDNWWYVDRDGTPVAGNNGAGIAVLEEIEMTKPVASLLRITRLSQLLNPLDGLIDRNRGWLADIVPDGRGPHRYP